MIFLALADSIAGAARFLFICLEVVLIFNLLIIVHEVGHFLAARWRGLYVEGFGIWFGKALWKKKINGVTYSLGSIPAGGFVKLPQMAPMDAIEGSSEMPPEAMKPITPLDKIIVAAAGPVFSLGLAFAFAIIVWIVGRPVSEAEGTTTIGFVMPGGAGEKAGLKAGDEILEIDGHKVTRFGGQSSDAVVWRIVRSEGETLPIKVQRDGQVLDIVTTPEIPQTKFWQRKGMRQLQIAPKFTPVIARIQPNTPASEAGILPNDQLLEVNGQRIFSEGTISDYAVDHPGEALVLTVERSGEQLKVPFAARGPLVGQTFKNSPAEIAGLKPGDRVTGVNSVATPFPEMVATELRKADGGPVTLQVERGSEKLSVTVTPAVPIDEKAPRIGIAWANGDGMIFDSYGKFKVIHPSPLEQVRAGFTQIFQTIAAVASPKSDIKLQHMGGPVAMMRIYYMLFESEQGWRLALWFSVVLNVNLALMNMFPIPVLDGGHITFAIIEAIRRKPVNTRALEIVNTAAAMLVIGFMLFVTMFDVQDLFGGGKRAEMRFAAPSAQSAKPQ